MSLWAVVPAAGSGRRMGGDTPKQYLEAEGRTLLEHSVRVLLDCTPIRAVCVVLPTRDERAPRLPLLDDARVRRTHGADQRSGSVLAGLIALSAEAEAADWVLVHDAARPCLRPPELAELIEAVTAAGVGGLLAEPLVDTVKQSDAARRVVATLDRDRLWRAQTPQMFRLGELRAALEVAIAGERPVTDEAAAMELAGHPVQLVRGPRHNIKITTAADLPLAEFYLRQGRDGL